VRTNEPHHITELLREARAGDASAVESLVPLVYAELRGLARASSSKAHKGHTLQPTALIHEAWLELAPHLDGVESRRHFCLVASRVMRQVLADHARRAGRRKRGDGLKRVTLDGALGSERAQLNARHGRVVELRVFGGLTIAETAEALELSHGTVESHWLTAKAWLRREHSPGR
jgi:RNA polymerase sigma factor (TIGR02999 family)